MNDLARYEYCMAYARTMMMMAKALEEKYGRYDHGFLMYVRKGIKSCELALVFKHKWDNDGTVILKLVA